MTFIRLVAAALVSFPLACSALSPIYSVTVGTGCQVAVDAPPGDTTYRWQGECKDGRAEGPGLLTSSHGGMLRGEFKKGQPYDAAGFWPLSFKGGGAVMTQMNVSNGVSMQDSIDLPNEQGRPSPTSSAPLAGEWNLTSGDGQCIEQHTYHADGSAEIKGGEEVMQSAYSLVQIAGNPELYGLMKTNVASNGKPDCGGRVTAVEPDDTRFTYLRREGPDEFATCSVSSKPLRCFGTLKRRQPQG
jgi:hypothetical protein